MATLRRQLKAAVARHYPSADLASLDRAFDFAVEAHAGQKRASGDAFVTHPVWGWLILGESLDWRMAVGTGIILGGVAVVNAARIRVKI